MNGFYTFLYILSWPIYHILIPGRGLGREHIPDGAALICGNHTSNSDPFLVAHAFTRSIQLHFMAKSELRRIPILGWFLKHMGAFFVSRGKGDTAAIKQAIRHLRAGDKVMMFPEGTRVRADEQKSAKTGAAMLALRTGAPILPVYIAARKRFFLPNPVVIGEPYHPKQPEGVSGPDRYQAVVDELMDKIKALEEQAK